MKTMKQEIYKKFHQYICEVVKHYKQTGSMRNFSKIARKYKCSRITQQMFFENSLHLIKDEPSFLQSCMIYDIVASKKKASRKPKAYKVPDVDPDLFNRPRLHFDDGQVVAWKWKSGTTDTVNIAVVDENGWFNYGYNVENDGDIYYGGNMNDYRGDIEYVEPPVSVLKEFLSQLAQVCWNEVMSNPRNALHFDYEKNNPTL